MLFCFVIVFVCFRFHLQFTEMEDSQDQSASSGPAQSRIEKAQVVKIMHCTTTQYDDDQINNIIFLCPFLSIIY